VVLEAPGSEPRRLVGHAIGAVSRPLVFELAMKVGEHDDTTKLGVAWSCEAGGPCRYQVSSKEIDGRIDPEINKMVTSAAGELSIQPDGSVLIQPTSFIKTTPSITEILRLASVRLPAQPFGVGARWTVTERDLRRTYTVTALTATALELSLTGEFDDGSASVKLAGTLGFDGSDPVARTLRIEQRQDAVPVITLRTASAR